MTETFRSLLTSLYWQIEKANLAELDWALANMGSSKSRKTQSMGEDWIAEPEAKVPKDKEDVSSSSRSNYDNKLMSSFYRAIYEALELYYSMMVKLYFLSLTLLKSNVGRMLAPPPTESREQDVIQKTLNSVGVMYSHHNDEILVPSRIEEERTKKMLVRSVSWVISSAAAYDLQKKRRRMSKPSSPAQGSAPVQWPPRRRHHKLPLTPEQQYAVIIRLSLRADSQYRLASRHQALFELGMINKPSDIPTFARDLWVGVVYFRCMNIVHVLIQRCSARQPPEMQKKILAELDKWVKMQAAEANSSWY